jgi:hypothetical protein
VALWQIPPVPVVPRCPSFQKSQHSRSGVPTVSGSKAIRGQRCATADGIPAPLPCPDRRPSRRHENPGKSRGKPTADHSRWAGSTGPDTRRPSHAGTRTRGDLCLRRPRRTSTRTHRDPCVRRPRRACTRMHSDLCLRRPSHSGNQARRDPDLQRPSHPRTRTHSDPGVRRPSRVGTRVGRDPGI